MANFLRKVRIRRFGCGMLQLDNLYTLTGHMGEIGAVTLLGDKALASGSSDGTVCIWDLDKIISSD